VSNPIPPTEASKPGHRVRPPEFDGFLGILDAFFRDQAPGALLRVERREVEPGRSTVIHGTYRKSGPAGAYLLVEGADMFPSVTLAMLRGERPSVFPDELVRSPEGKHCTFKFATRKGAAN